MNSKLRFKIGNTDMYLRQNISRNYLFMFLYNLDLTRGIWMIYLASRGMSLTQLGLLETIFHLTSFTMEVPTGAVADLFGRKTSRVVGRLFSLISVCMLFAFNHFWGYALSFIFSALSYNLESGAGDALVYDSLKVIGEEEQYMRINGLKELFYQLSSILSFFVGGYLATKSYQAAFYLTMGIGIVTILQSTTFVEPHCQSGAMKAEESTDAHQLEAGNLKETNILKSAYLIFKNQLFESIAVVRSNRRIAFLIIFGQMIGTFCTCIFYYNQNFLKSLMYSEFQIGIVLAVSSFSAAIISTQVHRIESFLKERRLLFWLPWVTVICIWGIVLSSMHYLFFIVMMMAESVSYVALTDYINRLIPSEYRATILSFASMVFSFFMIVMFPLVGVLADAYSIRSSFMALGGFGILFVMLNGYFLSKQGA